ncbi:Peptidase family M20/M25/M40/Peptidase dimerisation domain containing protein, putative [Angomonas deanei]|uniref:Peptidase family M20/M25/M40/Peptidase dimerisation domain containing protein, putative n=1 Tax=Angomonas deanei TaxID=59799 RepID=A0A7G2C9W5_9TRYP|nr:Peptidase family M20/M25/M40/Peptidase dimerisation domain containing protein, putative [Angomonas deanei]
MNKDNLERAIALRRELHTHPELSNEEVWTKARLLEFLKKNTKNLTIKDEKTWFYAVYHAKGNHKKENIAFRADFDALPMAEGIDIPWASKVEGKSHKCGHDGHSSSMMAFAMEVDQKGAPNNLFFLWQPAEEVGEGALQCLPLIERENITRIFGYHNLQGFPLRSVAVRDEVIQCASVGMIIKLKGTPAHASQPESGRNPSRAIAYLIEKIPEETKKSTNLLLCTVVQVNVGNRQFGMSAYYGELLLTIRAVYEKELEELRDNLIQLSKKKAQEDGLEVSFEYSDYFPETRNDPKCTDMVRQVAKERNIQLVEMKDALRPSEDFGHYTKKCPGSYFFIGNGVDYPPIHTTPYDFRDEIIEVSVEMFKGLAGMTTSPSL